MNLVIGMSLVLPLVRLRSLLSFRFGGTVRLYTKEDEISLSLSLSLFVGVEKINEYDRE